MSSITFFLVLIPVLGSVLLAVNFLLAPHTPYQEKNSVFECGFHSFLGQNRSQFSISFFIFGLLFLLFDLEILLIYPFGVTASINDIYGLSFMLIFFLLLTLGFVFELGKQALKIDSRQTTSNVKSVVLASGIFHNFFMTSISKLQDKNVWIRIFTVFAMGLIVRIVVNGLWDVNIFVNFLSIYSLLAYFYIAIFNILISINFPIDILSSKDYQLQFKSRNFFFSSLKDLKITSFKYAKMGEDTEYKIKCVKSTSYHDLNTCKNDGLNEDNKDDNINKGQNLGGTSGSSNNEGNIRGSTSNITSNTDVPKNKKRSYLNMVQLSGNDSVVTESNPRKKIKTSNLPGFAGDRNVLNSNSSSLNFPGDRDILNSKNVKTYVGNRSNTQEELTKEEKHLLKFTTKNTTRNTGVKRSAKDINKEIQAMYRIYNKVYPIPKFNKEGDNYNHIISSKHIHNFGVKSNAQILEEGNKPFPTRREVVGDRYKGSWPSKIDTWYNGSSPERTRDLLHIANDRAVNNTIGVGQDHWNFVTNFSKDEIIKNYQESTPLCIGNKVISDALNSKHMGHPENRDILNNMYNSLSGRSFYSETRLNPVGPIVNNNLDVDSLKITSRYRTLVLSMEPTGLMKSRYVCHVPNGILKDYFTSVWNKRYLKANMKSLLAINAESLVREGNFLTITSEQLAKNVKYLIAETDHSKNRVKSVTKNLKFIDEAIDNHNSLSNTNSLDVTYMEKFGVSDSIENIIGDLGDSRMKKQWFVKDGLLRLTKPIIMVHTPGWTTNYSRSIHDSLAQPKDIVIGSILCTEIYDKKLIKDPSICHGADLRELLQLFEYRWFTYSDVDALEQFNGLSSSQQLIILKLTSQALENELIGHMKDPRNKFNMWRKDFKHWSSGKFLNGNLTKDENKIISEYAIATRGTFPGSTDYKYVFALLQYLSNKNNSNG